MSHSKNAPAGATLRFSALWGSYSVKNPEAAAAFLQKPAHLLLGRQTARNVVMLACALLLALPSFAAGKASKTAPDFNGLSGDAKVDVIIQFTLPPTASDIAAASALGGVFQKRLDVINGVLLSQVPVGALNGLANNPRVKYISPDRVTKTSGGVTADYMIQTVEADLAAATYGVDGTGVGVAIVDSGIWNHPDLNSKAGLSSRIAYSESFVAGSTSTSDAYGHGTHVAGIVAGNGAASLNKVHGVAPNVSLINLRVLDGNGAGTDSGVISAIQRAIQLKGQYNIRVLNLSIGRAVMESYALDPLCQATEQAWQAGIVVVVAAGNSGRDNSMHTHGYGTIASPGIDPFVITVGASNTRGTLTRADDAIASFSSKGPTLIDHIVKPDLVAPGNQIVSLRSPGSTLDTLLGAAGQISSDEMGLTSTATTYTTAQYFVLSGTSMATPVVAGAAALLIQQNPAITPDQVKARLMKTAYKSFQQFTSAKDTKGNVYNNQLDVLTYGAGYLDVYAALTNTALGQGYAISPSVTRNSLGKVVLLTDGSLLSNSILWGNSVLWGVNVVWSDSVLWGLSVVWGGYVLVPGSPQLWGDGEIWGSNTDAGYSILWGTSVLWGLNSMTALSAGDSDEVDDSTLVTAP